MVCIHRLSVIALTLCLLAGNVPGAGTVPAQAQGTLFVNAASTCSVQCGGSWPKAYPKLQDAIAAARSGDQIWVAKGVYYPDEGAGLTNNDPTLSFTLKNGVRIYGGFGGGENSLNQRNPTTNVTILSGDIDKNDANTDGNFIAETPHDIVGQNTYYVVSSNQTQQITVLDGFVITAGQGGGMFNDHSSPQLANLTFSGNSATDGGGMLNIESHPTLTNVTFRNNSASADGVGGGMANDNSNPTLTNVTFSGNSAAWGGGMYDSNSTSTLTNVTFSGNSATEGGGGMANDNSTSTLTDVTFSGNRATEGGGMFNDSSTPTLTDVTFSGNRATEGGGMFNDNSTPTLTNVTFSGNSATEGGGMFNSHSNLILSNVTISGNSATEGGGGMFNYKSNPTLTNVTFSGNRAAEGGGMFSEASSSLSLINVLIANSVSGGDCRNVSGAVIASGSSHNLIEGTGANACELVHNVNGNIIGRDPKLGPLQNNGGHTLTHALLSGSPAINAGTNSGCPATDQRGIRRPQGGVCDIGAYERAFNRAYLPLVIR